MNIPGVGGNPPMRPDQEMQPQTRAGSGPAPSGTVIRAREVIISGPSGGMFVYNANQTALESSNVGAPTTDPILGFAVPQGFATYNAAGRVINLLSTASSKGAFFQYRDRTGIDTAQGIMILAVSSIAGTDPVTGASYPVGLYGVDFAFGSTIQSTGSIINLNQVSFTRPADINVFIGGGAANPGMKVDAPEQGVATHLQLLLQGTSPDGTQPAQGVIGPVSGATTLTNQTAAMLEIQGGTGQTVQAMIADVAASIGMAIRVTGDAHNRLNANAAGQISWGSGAANTDCDLLRLAAHQMGFSNCDLAIHTAGRGLQVAEGSNAKQGTGTLAAGTATIANTSVTANSRILVTGQPGGANRGGLNVTTITAGTSFVVTSTNAADTGVFAYEIFEPG